jgi:hypothetical protein
LTFAGVLAVTAIAFAGVMTFTGMFVSLLFWRGRFFHCCTVGGVGNARTHDAEAEKTGESSGGEFVGVSRHFILLMMIERFGFCVSHFE